MTAVMYETQLRQASAVATSAPNNVTNISAVPGVPNAGDVNSFNNQMNIPGNMGVLSSPEAFNNFYNNASNTINQLRTDLREAAESQYVNRLSDFIDVVKARLGRINKYIAPLMQKPDLSQSDLLYIQYEVMQMSIILDVASKAGDKGSQALQTLFRDK